MCWEGKDEKIISFIALLAVIFSCMYYGEYIKKGHEEIEVLNKDVSINNIKSIIEIEIILMMIMRRFHWATIMEVYT